MNRVTCLLAVFCTVIFSLSVLGCSFSITPENPKTNEVVDDTYTITDGALLIKGIYANEATLTWTLPSRNGTLDGLQYQIVRSDISNIGSLDDVNLYGAVVRDWTSNIAESVVRDMNPNTTYYFNVVVKDEKDRRSVYTMTNLTTTDGPVPGSNGLIAVTSLGSNTIRLSWTTGSDAVFAQSTLLYRAYFSTIRPIESVDAMEKYGTPASALSNNYSSCVIPSLTEGNIYYLNVLLANGNGQKASYAQRSVIFDNTPPAPGVLSFARVMGTSMRIQWSSTTDNYSTPETLQYRLVFSATSNIDTVGRAFSNGTVLMDWQSGVYSNDKGGLTANTAYYFNVLVRDEAGNIGMYGMVSQKTAYADGNLLVNPSMEGGSQEGQYIPNWYNSWVPLSAGYKTMWNFTGWPDHCHTGTFGVYMYTANVTGISYCNISQVIPWAAGDPVKSFVWTRSGRGTGSLGPTTFIPTGYAFLKINFINSSNGIIGTYTSQVDNTRLYAWNINHWDNRVLTLETPNAPAGTAYLQFYVGLHKPDTGSDAYQLVFSFDDAYCGVNNLSPTAPLAVTDLIAAGDNGSVELVWSAPDSGGSVITGYEIQYGTGGSFDRVYLDDAKPGAVITGLNNGQAYQFRVVAKNALGSGVPSNIATVTPNVASMQDVVWTDVTNATVTGEILTKTNASAAWDTGAASTATFIGNGGVEFVADNNTDHRMCGLSVTNPDPNYTTIQYALHAHVNHALYVYEMGALKGPFLTYSANDKLSVERVGDRIVCKRNGRIFYVSATPSTNSLMADCSIYTSGGAIQSAKLFTR